MPAFRTCVSTSVTNQMYVPHTCSYNELNQSQGYIIFVLHPERDSISSFLSLIERLR